MTKENKKQNVDATESAPGPIPIEQEEASEAIAAEQPEPEAPAEKKDDTGEKYLRAIADLENYRKRAAREQQRASQFSVAALARGLLPALDNFERALSSAESAHDFEALAAGVKMVEQQIYQTLRDNRIEEVNALHQPFDPSVHEVVVQEPTNEYEEGIITKVFERGFKIDDIVIRAAKVAVAGPAPDAEQSETEEPEDES